MAGCLSMRSRIVEGSEPRLGGRASPHGDDALRCLRGWSPGTSMLGRLTAAHRALLASDRRVVLRLAGRPHNLHRAHSGGGTGKIARRRPLHRGHSLNDAHVFAVTRRAGRVGARSRNALRRNDRSCSQTFREQIDFFRLIRSPRERQGSLLFPSHSAVWSRLAGFQLKAVTRRPLPRTRGWADGLGWRSRGGGREKIAGQQARRAG